MRRISRRHHGELIIHKWWINALLAVALGLITAGFWLWLKGWFGFVAGSVSFGFTINRATEAVRVSRQ